MVDPGESAAILRKELGTDSTVHLAYEPGHINTEPERNEGGGRRKYEDSDGDGYGNNASSTLACGAPAGYVIDNTDCDDSNSALRPGVTWYADRKRSMGPR